LLCSFVHVFLFLEGDIGVSGAPVRGRHGALGPLQLLHLGCLGGGLLLRLSHEVDPLLAEIGEDVEVGDVRVDVDAGVLAALPDHRLQRLDVRL